MSTVSTATGDWVEHLLHNIAYQPDDEIFQHALTSDISSNFQATINGHPTSREEFGTIIGDARKQGLFVLESSRELLASTSEKEPELCTVAHIQKFRLDTKDTAPKQSTSSLTICTVALEGGKRTLVQMAEVTITS